MHKRSWSEHESQSATAGKGEQHKSALRVDHIQERSSDDVVRALRSAGFRLVREHGWRIELEREEPRSRIIVPQRVRINRGRLHTIAAQAGLTMEEFKNLLDA